MRGSRDAMQDVEIVDVESDVPLLGPADEDPAERAARAERIARRRLLLRRWWPAPVAAIVLLLGVQGVVDARERQRVADWQEVEGVLHTVDPALEPTQRLTEGIAGAALSGIVAGDLRIGPGADPWQAPRVLVAIDPDGQVVWRTSLEAGDGAAASPPGFGLDTPLCLAHGDPTTAIRCLVLDRDPEGSGTADEDEAWLPGPPRVGRLLTVDAATGEVAAEDRVPPVSAWGGGEGTDVLVSVSDTRLTVTAWDADSAPDDPPLWRENLDLDPSLLTPEVLVFPPSVRVARGHVMVQGQVGSWVLDAADGHTAGEGDVTLTRGGHLARTAVPADVLDDEGRVIASLPGAPVVLAVDDGSEPGIELVTGSGGDPGTLVGYDVAADRERWSLPTPAGAQSGLVLLGGALYGVDEESLWAVEVATGHELWRVPAYPADVYGGVLTDGDHLLLLSAAQRVEQAGVTVTPAAGEAPAPASVATQALAAYDLGTGGLAWVTRLPREVQGVWSWQGNLLGYGEEEYLVLN